MALTVVVEDSGLHDKLLPGAIVARRASITVGQYATGGIAPDPDDFDLHTIVGIYPGSCAVATWVVRLVAGSLMAFVQATGAEVADEADLATCVVDCLVLGY